MVIVGTPAGAVAAVLELALTAGLLGARVAGRVASGLSETPAGEPKPISPLSQICGRFA